MVVAFTRLTFRSSHHAEVTEKAHSPEGAWELDSWQVRDDHTVVICWRPAVTVAENTVTGKL